MKTTAIALALAAFTAAAAHAQEPPKTRAAAGEPPVVALSAWDQGQLRRGYSVEAMMGGDVHNPDGDEVGEIEDVVVGADKRIQSLIVAAGGVLDLGDTHYAVPWDRVRTGDGGRLVVPIDGGEAGRQAGVREVGEDWSPPARAWKVSEILGDVLQLHDLSAYGYVRDVIFGRDGRIQAVLARPRLVYGDDERMYAFPFFGHEHGFDPQAHVYVVPYDREDVAGVKTFSYDAFEIATDPRRPPNFGGGGHQRPERGTGNP